MDATQLSEAKTQAAPEPPKDAPAPRSRITVPSIVVAAVVGAIVGLSVWYLVRGQPLLVQGEVDATRFDMAARVDGRVAEIPVNRGQDVAAGAVLVKIDNPALAQKNQAITAELVAKAQLAHINDRGSR